MPVPAYIVPWIVGNTIRYGVRSYGQQALATLGGSYAGYKAGRAYKRKYIDSAPVVNQMSDIMMTQQRPPRRKYTARLKNDVAKQLFNEDQSGYVQRADIRRTYGSRYVSKGRKLQNMLKSHVDRIVETYRCNQTNVPSNTPNSISGTFKLCAGPRTPFGGNWQAPIYLFDLTGVRNNNCSSGPTSGYEWPNIGHTVNIVDTVAPFSGNFVYNPNVYGRDVTDVNNISTWQTEEIGTAVSAAPPKVGQNCYLDGIRINMAVYGAKSKPSKVFVELWRFTDEELCPDFYCMATATGTAPTSAYTSLNAARVHRFYQTLFASSIGNGLGLINSKGDLKGVHRKRLAVVDFNPTSEFEVDKDGHQRNLFLNIPLNKYMKMDWYTDTSFPAGDTTLNPDIFNVTLGGNNEMPVPRATSRIFLVVRAQVSQSHASAAITNAEADAIYPSFDFVIRRYRSSIKT